MPIRPISACCHLERQADADRMMPRCIRYQHASNYADYADLNDSKGRQLPDRLSVRGSLYLLDRIRRRNYSVKGLGTLWSLYRTQNPMHRKIVEASGRGVDPYSLLPKPFETVIPNASAIAEAAETGREPASFKAKYTPPFAKLYTALCEEIVARSQWQTDSATSGRTPVTV